MIDSNNNALLPKSIIIIEKKNSESSVYSLLCVWGSLDLDMAGRSADLNGQMQRIYTSPEKNL